MNAFEIRCRFNHRMAQAARAGINFTQDLIDAKWLEIKAEVEAG